MIDFSGFLSFLVLLPDEPTTLKFIKIKSRSVKLCWLKPKNEGKGYVSRFWIKLKKNNVVIQNITTRNANVEYKIKNLVPFTTYEISIAAGNMYGFGKEIVASLKTSEEGKVFLISSYLFYKISCPRRAETFYLLTCTYNT